MNKTRSQKCLYTCTHMVLLEPNASQKKPTSAQTREMCQQIHLECRFLNDSRLNVVLDRLRETHVNGGALFASFHVGPNEAFDWFASRGRLLEFGILRRLLERSELADALPALRVPQIKPDDPALAVRKLKEQVSSEQLEQLFHDEMTSSLWEYWEYLGIGPEYETGETEFDGNFRVSDSFCFDGELARELFAGGAYTCPQGDGRAEKEKSLAFCEALFGFRFSEVWHCWSRSAWTPWFANVTGDWTTILFDRRLRALSILATTDSD